MSSELAGRNGLDIHDRAWRRTLLRHVAVAAGYTGLFIVGYFLLQSAVREEAAFRWYQQKLSWGLVLCYMAHLGFLILRHFDMWKAEIRHFFHAPYSPYNLAFFRFIFFALLAGHIAWFVIPKCVPLTELPDSARASLPLMGWFIHNVPITPTLYTITCYIALIGCSMAAVGFLTRPALLVVAPVLVYVLGVPNFYGKLSHYQFLTWVPMLLAFAPSAEVASVDAAIRRMRGLRPRKKPHFRYGLALKFMFLILGGVYGFSAVRKLVETGLIWALSDNPVNLFRVEWLENFREIPAIRIDKFPLICSIGAMGVIIFEIAYPFLLLRKTTRVIAAISASAFHLLNGYFLNIDFTYLRAAHVAYFDWHRGYRWLKTRHPVLRWLAVLATSILIVVLTHVPFLLALALLYIIFDAFRSYAPRQWRGILKSMARSIAKRKKKPKRASDRIAWQWRIGLFLVAVNWIFGIFAIHSWPFSSYPTYSFFRKSTIEYAFFLPQTADGTRLDPEKEAQKVGFRQENILPMAEAVVAAYRYFPESTEEKALRCWLRWQVEVPKLAEAVTAEVVIREIPVDPDRYGEIVKETEVGHFELKHGEWRFHPLTLEQ